MSRAIAPGLDELKFAAFRPVAGMPPMATGDSSSRRTLKRTAPMESEHIPNLYLGTSSWSAESWGAVLSARYGASRVPSNLRDRLQHSANWLHVLPHLVMVQGWRDCTPPGFIFAAKFPGEITHKKLLVDCNGETDKFLGLMELLGEKFGLPTRRVQSRCRRCISRSKRAR